MVNKNKYSLKEKRTAINEVPRYNYRWVVSIGGFLSNTFVFIPYERNSAVFIRVGVYIKFLISKFFIL